jgi:hypothetical protein
MSDMAKLGVMVGTLLLLCALLGPLAWVVWDALTSAAVQL